MSSSLDNLTTVTRQRHLKVTPSTSRCFTSLVEPSQEEKETTEAYIQIVEALDDGEFDHDPDEDSNTDISGDETMDDDDINQRIWMDPETPLEQRVSRFINQPLGSIHHLDIKLTSIDLIKACGKQKSFEGMKNAQDILDRLIEEKKYTNNSQENNNTSLVVIPDRPFKMVMYGWANMCEKVKFAPQRMREVLDLMIQEEDYDTTIREERAKSLRIENKASGSDANDDVVSEDDENSYDNTPYDDDFAGLSCQPTVDIYNTLLQGLSKASSRSIQAAIEAEHALSRMDKMNRTRGWHTKPNTRSYSLVLNAYAKTRHATSGDRAETVLREMIDRHEYEKQEYLEEYGIEYNSADPELNNRKIVTPDTVAYTTVIQAHGHSDSQESADKALMLLDELIQSENPALEPDSFAFANTINAFSKMASRKKNPNERVEAAERAEGILWMMVDEVKKKKSSSSKDTERSLTGSIVPFNACLNAWTQSFTPESPYRAEDLLHKMLDPELQSIAEIEPNTVSFNTCMQAWSKACKFEESAAPEKAEELLQLLVKLSNEEGNLRPDVRSYATVMNAYALSRKENGVSHTRRLLVDLIQEGRGIYFDTSGRDKINAHPFTVVLKAAANDKSKNSTNDSSSDDADEKHAFGSLNDDDPNEGILVDDPYTIALHTYSELLNDTYELGVRPDHFAFAEMLAVVARYTDVESIERRQRVEEVFHDASSSGQVSSLVVRAMEKACPNDIVLRDLLRLRRNDTVSSIESINIFPKQWTASVPQEFRRVTSRNEHFRKQSKYFRTKKNSKSKGGKGSFGSKPKRN